MISDGRGSGSMKFEYHDDDGRLVAQKLREDLGNGNKTFWQRQRVFDVYGYRGKGTPYRSDDGHWWVDRIETDTLKALPYRPDEQQAMLNGAMPSRVFTTEGERDARAILDAGEVATTILQVGHEKEWAEWFRGYKGTVLVVVDNDGVGASQGLAKREALISVGVKVEMLHPPDDYKDVRDMLEDGKPLAALRSVTVKELRKIARSARDEPGVRQSGDDYPEWVMHLGTKVSRKLTPEPKKKRKQPQRPKWSPRKELPPPNDPMAVARAIENDLRHDGHLTLYRWKGAWMEWRRERWAEVTDRRIRAMLFRVTESARFAAKPRGDKPPEMVRWSPNTSRITNLADALSAVTYLDDDTEVPAWLEGEQAPIGPIVSCTNGLLEVGTRERHSHTPTYFNLVAVPFDYDPDAPEPEKWLRFLDEQWKNDPDQTAALQEWFGYVLSGRTDLQKILGLFGATRSGKGTIGRILTALLGGRRSVASPTLKGLGERFGLQDLVGKSLAMISDVRLGNRADIDTVVERLLSISGEDSIDVDRKNRDSWVGVLSTRLMILSNVEPSFRDESGAIAGRFIPLRHTVSFLGREDPDLFNKLVPELPGILNWALDGLERLERQGRFTEAKVSMQMVQDMRSGSSRLAPFVEEECVTGRPDRWTSVNDLFARWQLWAGRNNVKNVGTPQSFGRSLQALLPDIEMKRRGGSRGRGQRRGYSGIALKKRKVRTDGRGPHLR